MSVATNESEPGDLSPDVTESSDPALESPQVTELTVSDTVEVDTVVDDGGSEEIVVDEEVLDPRWYILKVQVNREESIRDALHKRVKIEGLDRYFGDIVVPTEDVAEFTKTGKRRIVKRKLFPGYIMVNMVINDETWFLVRETPGIGDFTGAAGKPTPMSQKDVEKYIKTVGPTQEPQVRTAIPFKSGDRVRVKEGNFQNFEGEVASIDETHGRVTVMIAIFGRATPVELEHWHIEAI